MTLNISLNGATVASHPVVAVAWDGMDIFLPIKKGAVLRFTPSNITVSEVEFVITKLY